MEFPADPRLPSLTPARAADCHPSHQGIWSEKYGREHSMKVGSRIFEQSPYEGST